MHLDIFFFAVAKNKVMPEIDYVYFHLEDDFTALLHSYT